MNSIDTARGYKKMLEMRGYDLSAADRSGVNQGISELARDLGISHSRISEDLGLLDEPAEVIKAIQNEFNEKSPRYEIGIINSPTFYF